MARVNAPATARWAVLFLLALGVLIAFVDRTSISSALAYGPFKQHFNLSDTDRGTIGAMFFWSYGLVQIPMGWLVDRYGVKTPYTICFAIWYIATAATGLVGTLFAPILMRILVGAAEAVVMPASYRWIRNNFTEGQSGTAVGIFTMGNKFGPAIGAPVAAWLIVNYDLETSLRFYTEVPGFILSDQDGDVAYLRGIEEAAHHSIVLTQADVKGATAECQGMRVRTQDDLVVAKDHFIAARGTAEFIERPYQGPSLLTSFGKGFPTIELVAWMETCPRMLNNFPAQKGGRVLRLDHYQCVVPDVLPTAVDRFLALGFRPSKYTTDLESRLVLSIFLVRKNNPHDLMLAPAGGPRLHYTAFVVSDLQAMMRAADIAGNLVWGRNVEHGPDRHGPPNGIFLYFRDPDGNRIEFILPPMQFMDPEDQPDAWNSGDSVSLVPWGGGPPQRWREEMSRFDGIEPEGGSLAPWTSLGVGSAQKGAENGA